MNYTDEDLLFAAIGEGHVTAQTVAERLGRELRGEEETETVVEAQRLPSTVNRRSGGRRRVNQSVGVHVEGLDDIMVRLSRCCAPVPPDEIIGFVTRGRGVSVHRSDCLNAMELSEGQPDRLIDVEWDDEHVGRFSTTIEILALDRAALLVDVARVLTDHGLKSPV